jgi:phosphohistidine phosphatase
VELYFLRHAIAVERGTPGYERDSERPLTQKGEKKMKSIAAGMKALGLEFDLILTSPYLRALRTAEIAASALGLGENLVVTAHLAADGEPERLVRSIVEDHGSAGKVLLVGHEPSMSALMSVLLAGNDEVSILFKKGGLAKLGVENLRYGRCAALEWLLTPGQLAALR